MTRSDLIHIIHTDNGGQAESKWVVIGPNHDGVLERLEFDCCESAVEFALFVRASAAFCGEPWRTIVVTDEVDKKAIALLRTV